MGKYLQLSHGFTLIELLVVIAVLGILGAGLAVVIDPVERLNHAQDMAAENIMREFAQAMEQRLVTSGSYYPVHSPGGIVLFNEASANLKNSGHLKIDIESVYDSYRFYYYSWTNTNQLSNTNFCLSGQKCTRFVTYSTSPFKSKAYEQKYANGAVNVYLIYDSKYGKICGKSLNPHTGSSTTIIGCDNPDPNSI